MINATDLWNPSNGIQPVELLVATWIILILWFLQSRRFWSERRALWDAFTFIPHLLWEYADWGYYFVGKWCYNGKIPKEAQDFAGESTIMMFMLIGINFSIWRFLL